MDLIKNLVIDGLNGFPIDFVPLFMVQILCAGMIGWLIQFIVNRKMTKELIKYGPLISISVAVMVSIVKYSLPFSVIGAAVILLFLKGKEFNRFELISLIMLVVAGVGCGVGSVIQTIIGFAVIFLVVLFTPLKE